MTPETSSERVAVVVWSLAHGARLTTRQVAELTGVKQQTAYAMMCAISRVLPLYQEKNVWQICTKNRMFNEGI